MYKPLMMTLLAGTLASALVGCNSPLPAYQDKLDTQQLSMANIDVQHDVRVKVLPVQRTGAGQMRVVVQVYNLRAWDYILDYRYYFVDAAGAQVDLPSGWQQLKVPPHGTAQFEFFSMSGAAADFRVEMRKVD